MELEWVGMVEEDGYNKTSWIFILLILLSVADQGVWVLLAETEGDVETVLLGDLPVELPDRGHTSVSTAGVNTPSLDRLQIWSEVDSISLTCNWERGTSIPAVGISLTSVQSSVTRGPQVEYFLVLQTAAWPLLSCRGNIFIEQHYHMGLGHPLVPAPSRKRI